MEYSDTAQNLNFSKLGSKGEIENMNMIDMEMVEFLENSHLLHFYCKL